MIKKRSAFILISLLFGLFIATFSNLFISNLKFQPVVRKVVDGPFKLVATSSIDGSFKSVTSSENLNNNSIKWNNRLINGHQARRGASYPWSTTIHGNELWMGTISQGWCVWPSVNLKWPLSLSTYQSQYTGCSVQDTLSSLSQIIVYNFETGQQELVNKDWLLDGGEKFDLAMKRHKKMSRRSVMGLRAAGTIGDIVFFVGHHKHAKSEGWLRIFAFNAKKRSFLGYRDIKGDTIRRFVAIKDAAGQIGFYTIIGAETGMLQNGQGPTVMLRWVGSQDKPFNGGNYQQTEDGTGAGWDIVSSEKLDGRHGMIGDFKQFKHYDGSQRLIMSSAAHPLLYSNDAIEIDPVREESKMLLSDPLPLGGWTKNNHMEFKVIFGMDQYDPDTKGRWGSKWGTTNIFNGYIYFGTYHQGTAAGYEHFKKADKKLFKKLTSTNKKHEEFAINQWRASSIFRMKLTDLDEISKGAKDPELLYGYENFNVVNDEGQWEKIPNKLMQIPLFGDAGMGNPGNIYSWTSLNRKGKLFWGFFDAFSGTHDLLEQANASRLLIIPGLSIPIISWKNKRNNSLTYALHRHMRKQMEENGNGKDFIPGGDLVVFEGYGPPRILTSKGFGNPCSNGIRNAEVLKDRVFFATSSWCNLSELAGSEFYEYIPELDTKNTQ